MTTAAAHTTQRPDASEYASFYAGYVARVPPGDVVEILRRQGAEVAALLRPLPEPESLRLHARYTWSIRQVVGHVMDAERIFTYRLLRVARGDQTPLPAFDENAYADRGGWNERPLAALLQDHANVRASTLSLLESLPAAAWPLRGTASGHTVSVRGLAVIVAGHERHHLDIMRARLRGS